ncbi:MAG: ABC transporter substrate-binding protein [Chloroflexota bacterium]|nr:ABC transporter substrate-binding protein [Chloroflexota bacterium]
MASDRVFSRRRFLGVLGGTAAMSIVAACGGQQTSPATKSETKPAESKPAESKPAAPAAQPAAKTEAKPAAGASAAGSTVVVWQPLDYLPQVTALMNERFQAISKEKGFNLTFEELPSGSASTDRFNAAVQAGTPPDIYRLFDYQNQYWRIQGQTVDVTEIVAPTVSQQGGYWQPVEQTLTFDGKWWAAPMAVNAWPFHVRQDLLDQAGLKYPKDWDEFRQQGKQLTKPPLYYYGMTLGRIDDTNNHFLGMLWTFGGKLQNDDGTLAVKEGDESWVKTLELVNAMFAEDQIIPPGAVGWDNTHNNQGYQSEQLVVTSNPTSVYNWLLQNKPELAKATKFYSYPAGPAGSFGQVDVWGQGVFKNGKAREAAFELLKGFIEPSWYSTYINDQLQGRFIPVYKEMINAPLWKQELYSEYQNIISNGRIMSYSSAPLGAISELTTKFLIGDLLQDVLVKKQKPADALAVFVRSAKEIYDKPENRR